VNRIDQHIQQTAADAAAGVSVVGAGYTWLATANEVAQLVASIVAIVAGIAAIVWHIQRIRQNRKENKND
jgi:hypothetical protein